MGYEDGDANPKTLREHFEERLGVLAYSAKNLASKLKASENQIVVATRSRDLYARDLRFNEAEQAVIRATIADLDAQDATRAALTEIEDNNRRLGGQ